MSAFVLHQEAFADLREIGDSFSADDTAVADRILTEIRDAIRMLVKYPHAGHARPELTSKPVGLAGSGPLGHISRGRNACDYSRHAPQPAKPSYHRRTSARAEMN